eukprot:scaffold1460_cov417-Prasinococcus_capsulatus_cf.AAC.5
MHAGDSRAAFHRFKNSKSSSMKKTKTTWIWTCLKIFSCERLLETRGWCSSGIVVIAPSLGILLLRSWTVLPGRSHGGQTVEVIFGVKQYAGDEEDYEEEADSEATQHPFTIRIENKDGSNMYFLCSTSLADGEFLVDYISFMDPHDNSNLTEFEYPGPQFSTLDESVQEGLMVYLSERGINEYLLAYMNLKMEDKENELYTEWLRKLHKQLS